LRAQLARELAAPAAPGTGAGASLTALARAHLQDCLDTLDAALAAPMERSAP
jgi:hypothetical protein